MSVKFKDYYQILGVKRRSDADAIKSAYRQLARRYHPDLNRDDATAEARFKEVQEAYDVLSDPGKRRQYDALGSGYREGMDFQMPNEWRFQRQHTGQRATKEGGFGGFSEFFEMLFGGRGKNRNAATAERTAPRGADLETVLPVSLEDIHQGVTKKVRMHVNLTCTACQGSGFIAGSRCGTCEGKGVAPRLRTMDLKIPRTVRDGTRLRLSGQGETVPGNGAKPGDLYVKIKVMPHPVFNLEGHNIHVELPVSPWEAVLGGEVDVPTLDGQVKMKLPPCTQNGVKLRLHQRGMVKESGRGDEIVRIKVMIPTDITDRERHLFRQLRDISHFRPRVKTRTSY